jgi:hypothetical protein
VFPKQLNRKYEFPKRTKCRAGNLRGSYEEVYYIEFLVARYCINAVAQRISINRFLCQGPTGHVEHARNEPAEGASKIKGDHRSKKEGSAQESDCEEALRGQNAGKANRRSQSPPSSIKQACRRSGRGAQANESNGQYARNERAGSAGNVAQTISGAAVFANPNAERHAGNADASSYTFGVAANTKGYARHADALGLAKSASVSGAENEPTDARRKSFNGSDERNARHGKYCRSADKFDKYFIGGDVRRGDGC